jgi:hypothetical protein
MTLPCSLTDGPTSGLFLVAQALQSVYDALLSSNRLRIRFMLSKILWR